MTEPATWEMHGYVIACQNDVIADASGGTPDLLKNDADWAYFQAELETCKALILGRVSHEANPNPQNRLRVIMSRSADALAEKSDGWWWNPLVTPLGDMLQAVAPDGGKIGVPGGQGPFDYFLDHGFSAFHFSRAEAVCLEAGLKVFSSCTNEVTAEQLLQKSGLVANASRMLDADARVSLSIWRPA